MHKAAKYKKPYTIVPFCLFHYLNHNEQTYRGYIGNPELDKIGDDYIYKCKKDNVELSNWKFVRKFYAISPMFRPVPTGMKLFCMETSDHAPFRTVKASVNYDMFTFDPDCTYFMTYNEPVSNTTPLFLYQLGDNVFPSFDNTPPALGWKEVYFSPIFVITRIRNDPHFDPNFIKFQCVNSRCIPYGPMSLRKTKKMSLIDCVIGCSEEIIDSTRPSDILSIVETMKTKTIFTQRNLIFGIFIFLVIIILIKIIE